MPSRKYQGSCHCGKIRYEAEIDLSKGSIKCNCTFCSKARNWIAIIKTEAFHLLDGGMYLGDYQFATKSFHHHFCKHCGVRTFSKGHLPVMGGDFVGISLHTLDNATSEELLQTPITVCDGRNNNWQSPPKEARYL